MNLERLALLAILFLITFVVSLAIVVAIVVRLPATYFTQKRRPFLGGVHPVPRIALIILKNVAGVAVVAAGLLMSLPGVPGQGFLTIFIGLMLVDFPGKYRLERAIIRRRAVHGIINRLRNRFGRPPLQIP